MNMTSLEHIVENSRLTILLGKNGAGKSTCMRELDSSNTLNTKYISPERGGTLKYDPNVDNNIATNQGWLENTRRQIRFAQFRQQSAAQFRTLEVLILRESERNVGKRNDHTYTFDRILGQINSLLPVICLVRSDKGFSIQSKD
jgi:ABC-type branched-subunit amino acid transport system ATPase component